MTLTAYQLMPKAMSYPFYPIHTYINLSLPTYCYKINYCSSNTVLDTNVLKKEDHHSYQKRNRRLKA